jgi:hypothetical protein
MSNSVVTTKIGVRTDAPHIPARGSKAYKLLSHLLRGVEIDAGYAYLELNLPTLQARASELRKLGWPVRALERPHPRLINEKTVYYLLDATFRQWIAENSDKHPNEYPGLEGRGKYIPQRDEGTGNGGGP